MSKERSMEDRKKLDRLHDAVIDSILSMSPEEAMEDTTPEDIEAMRAGLAKAAAKVGRSRLARAKAEAAADARRLRPSRSTGDAEALKQARANDDAFDKKLTLAARKGGPDFEADRAGIAEDLEELRRWDDDEDPA